MDEPNPEVEESPGVRFLRFEKVQIVKVVVEEGRGWRKEESEVSSPAPSKVGINSDQTTLQRASKTDVVDLQGDKRR